MTFVGRTSELGRLRAALDRRAASVVQVTGMRGCGKSALVARVLDDYDAVSLVALPLPDRSQRASFAQQLDRARFLRGFPSLATAEVPSWASIVSAALELAKVRERPLVLAIDDTHRLTEARARYLEAVGSLVLEARRIERTVHVVLIGPEHALPPEDDFGEHSGGVIRVGPLPFRAACALLPGDRPTELVRAYGVFGGIPRVLRLVDRDVTLGTNIRRLVFEAGGGLTDVGGTWLERDVQTPARYYAILSALARGEAEWAAVHASLPDLTQSGQVAPYLRKLEGLGLVAARRSLDARPNARWARYAIADPFLSFWARFALGAPQTATAAEASHVYATFVRPDLDAHVATGFPLVCRQHMLHDAIETVGANAREGGSLWGSGYDIPVAGILTSGAAYYGCCHWASIRAQDAPLDRLDEQVHETRYGFGRERRLRLVFSGREASGWLRRAIARRGDAELIDAAALVGAR